MKRRQKNRETLEQVFPSAYIAHGLNGTRAYKSLKPNITDKSAGVLASRQLEKVSVQERIRALLPSEEIESKAIHDALTGDIERPINWTERHKYLETSLKLKGLLKSTPEQGNTNIGIIIER